MPNFLEIIKSNKLETALHIYVWVITVYGILLELFGSNLGYESPIVQLYWYLGAPFNVVGHLVFSPFFEWSLTILIFLNAMLLSSVIRFAFYLWKKRKKGLNNSGE